MEYWKDELKVNCTIDELHSLNQQLELAEISLKMLDKEKEKIMTRINELRTKITTYKIDNKLFHPISELSNYIGKNIIAIELIERFNKDDNNITIERLYSDGIDIILDIDKNGHLYYSSLIDGYIEYNENNQIYEKYKNSHVTEHDFIGFLDIVIDNRNKNEDI